VSRRRSTASLLLAAAFLVSQAASASAADPHDRLTSGHARPGAGGTSTKKTDASTQAAPGANGLIAFGRSPVADWPTDIWVIQSNGTGATKLTSGTLGIGDTEPAWSPGGAFIAFARDQTATTEDSADDIYVMTKTGTGVRRLTTNPAGDFSPDWTPNGARIVFASERTGAIDIYSMKSDGTDVKRLTTNAAFDLDPTVSPDGTKIAFSSNRSGDFEIYTMNLDGTGVSPKTSNDADDFYPDWSPDGAKIAFTSDLGEDVEIMAMDADGSDVVNVSDDPAAFDSTPAWSPDGAQIIFDSITDTDYGLYIVPAAGGMQTPIAATGDDEWNADWQPVPTFPLVDARFSLFNSAIMWVYEQGITVGCNAERYCPDDSVTRGQMATFLVRALDLPPTETDYFTDDETTNHEDSINRVKAAGITSGCAPSKYCPETIVTRDQMATFLARALALPASTTDYFTDDNGSSHEQSINRVRAAGITSGCTATTYCPTAPVTRGQMAAFLQRALD
jgi:hypothetical protein